MRRPTPARGVLCVGLLVATALGGCASEPKEADRGATEQRGAVVEHLMRVRRTGRPVSPVSAAFGGLAVEEAYAVQHRLVDRLVEAGLEPTGYKVAFASASAQKARGLTEPAYGRLFRSMRVPRGESVSAGVFHRFHAEVEVAYVLDEAVGRPPETLEKLRSKIRSVHPALDLADLRYDPTVARPTAADLIADGVGAHRYVLGKGRSPATVQVEAITARLIVDGETFSEAPVTAGMGHPLKAVRWLAEKRAAHGRPLKSGEVVLTGVVGKIYRASRKEGRPAVGTYVGDLGSLGRVRCRVVEPAGR